MRGAIKLAVIAVAAAAATFAVGRAVTGRSPGPLALLAGTIAGTLAIVVADILIGW